MNNLETTTKSIDALQNTVDSLLTRGVIFSIIWLMGVGSLISVLSASKAYRIIRAHDGQVSGMFRVWWCFLVGGLGILVWLGIISLMVLNNLK